MNEWQRVCRRDPATPGMLTKWFFCLAFLAHLSDELELYIVENPGQKLSHKTCHNL